MKQKHTCINNNAHSGIHRNTQNKQVSWLVPLLPLPSGG